MLRDFAESLNTRRDASRLEPERVEHQLQNCDDPITGRFHATGRPAKWQRLPGNESWLSHAAKCFELVEHPRHVPGRRGHVWRGHVDVRTEIRGQLTDP